MKKEEVKALRRNEQEIEELMLKEGKVYMPKDKELKTEIIWLYHNVLVVGHGRR